MRKGSSIIALKTLLLSSRKVFRAIDSKEWREQSNWAHFEK